MKFLQIHHLYGYYLRDYHSRFPEKKAASHTTQVKNLIQDAFFCTQIFAPDLSKIGYDARLVISSDQYSQKQWLKEHRPGLQIPEEGWYYLAVKEQIEEYQPDILYITQPTDFQASFFAKLKHLPRLIVGWRAAFMPANLDWSCYNLVLSNLSWCQQMATQCGAKAVHSFVHAFPEFLLKKISNTPKCYDVVFSGQWTKQHQRRNRFLTDLALWNEKRKEPLALGFFLASPDDAPMPDSVSSYNQGARWGLDMFHALQTGRIVLNGTIDVPNAEAGNMRLFETTGAGSFMLTPLEENLEAFFQTGAEVETYKDSLEMTEKIEYFLKNEREREAIATKGHQRCLQDHGMSTRARELDRILQKFL